MYIKKFSWFCQHSLPAVYTDALSYYETLCKVIAKLNETVDGCNLALEKADSITALQNQVNQLFQNLDSTVREQLEAMLAAGEFDDIIGGDINKHNDLTIVDGVIEFGSADNYGAGYQWHLTTGSVYATVVLDKGVYTITENNYNTLIDGGPIDYIKFTGLTEGTDFWVSAYRIVRNMSSDAISEINVQAINGLESSRIMGYPFSKNLQGNPKYECKHIFVVRIKE